MLRAILNRDSQGRPILSKEELHHLLRVRRLRSHQQFLGLDVARQTWFRCRLASQSGPGVEVLGEEPQDTESALHLTLAASLIQRDRFEWILQKGVELGVGEIVPVRTRRSEFHIPSKGQAKLIERWKRILREAVKQCGRCRIPHLGSIQELPRYLESQAAELRFYLDEAGGRPLGEVLASCKSPSSGAVLIGPEGGWEESERSLIRQSGFAAAYLGARVLRSETAAIATLAILQYEHGDYRHTRIDEGNADSLHSPE